MRICMLNDNFYRGSGITIVLQRLVKTHSFKDLEIYLAGCETLDGKKAPQEDTSMAGAGRYRFFPLMQSGLALAPALLKFAYWLRRMNFDVLHVHHRRLAVLADVTKSLHGTPVLFTGHLTFPDAAWFRSFAPRTVTGVSPSVVEYLRRCTRASEISLIYNPVQFPAVELLPRSAGPQRVISIGRLEPIKGYTFLIEAWSRLRHKGIDAKLDIFGEGSLRSSLEGQITALDAENAVRLCGFAPDVAQRISGYNFHVLVSQKEGFPNSVVEAAAYGIPTLLTDVDGSRDALPAQLTLPNGLPYGDVDALSEALATWLGSPQDIDADGMRFRESLKSRCLPEVVGRQYLEVYSSLASKKAAHARR